MKRSNWKFQVHILKSQFFLDEKSGQHRWTSWETERGDQFSVERILVAEKLRDKKRIDKIWALNSILQNFFSGASKRLNVQMTLLPGSTKATKATLALRQDCLHLQLKVTFEASNLEPNSCVFSIDLLGLKSKLWNQNFRSNSACPNW